MSLQLPLTHRHKDQGATKAVILVRPNWSLLGFDA